MRTNTKSRPGDHIGMGLENRLGVGVENRMKQVVSRIPAQRPCAHHRARLLGLILTAVPFAIAGDAQACTVLAVLSSFASSSTVDCTGSTSNSGPGPGIGYGTINDINNTYEYSRRRDRLRGAFWLRNRPWRNVQQFWSGPRH